AVIRPVFLFTAPPDAATPALSLHDALPICALAENYNAQLASQRAAESSDQGFVARTLQLFRSIFVWQRWDDAPEALLPPQQEARSEEHTSELQSRENLVCRLLLEKKKPRVL